MTSQNSLARVANQLARGEFMSLDAAIAKTSRFLVIDDSGSMASYTDNTEVRKVDAVRKIVHQFREEGIDFRQIVFGNTVEIREDIPEPAGSTPLTEALVLAKTHGATQVAVLSDGIPDNPATALAAAKDLGVKIDTFYVGPRPSEGEVFMAQLASQSGGSSHVGDLGKGIKALEDGVKKVLLALPAAIAL
jgi:hypothetical protein